MRGPVLLIRHGIAIARDDPRCPPDPERALTSEGRAKTALAARGLRAVFDGTVEFIVSPYVRAQQTADVFEHELNVSARRVSDALLPFADPRAVLDEFVPDRASVLIGHAPHLDLLLELMCGARARLKKSSCALVRDGELVFALPPKALRALGRNA